MYLSREHDTLYQTETGLKVEYLCVFLHKLGISDLKEIAGKVWFWNSLVLIIFNIYSPNLNALNTKFWQMQVEITSGGMFDSKLSLWQQFKIKTIGLRLFNSGLDLLPRQIKNQSRNIYRSYLFWNPFSFDILKPSLALSLL